MFSLTKFTHISDFFNLKKASTVHRKDERFTLEIKGDVEPKTNKRKATSIDRDSITEALGQGYGVHTIGIEIPFRKITMKT